MSEIMPEVGGERSVDTAFGTVTKNQVIYSTREVDQRWVTGGSTVAAHHFRASGDNTESRRSILLGLIGLGAFAAGGGGGVLVGLITLACAALHLWGSPTVIVNTAGDDRRHAKGFPWTRMEQLCLCSEPTGIRSNSLPENRR